MDNKYFMIGELAKKMGISVRTLQYYDKENILKPSMKSEGGRRLYCAKDIVTLYQILSLKDLSFSLDEVKRMLSNANVPSQIAELLEKQNILVKDRILELQRVSDMISSLHKEVLLIDTIDFEKYADIITLLKNNNDFYWVSKLLDKELEKHVDQRFADQPELAIHILDTYQSLLNETALLLDNNVSFKSKRSMDLAKRWWDMVMKFTDGDMSLLPKLMEFNQNKSGWNEAIAEKQKKIDEFIGLALEYYFSQNEISVPELEE